MLLTLINTVISFYRRTAVETIDILKRKSIPKKRKHLHFLIFVSAFKQSGRLDSNIKTPTI